MRFWDCRMSSLNNLSSAVSRLCFVLVPPRSLAILSARQIESSSSWRTLTAEVKARSQRWARWHRVMRHGNDWHFWNGGFMPFIARIQIRSFGVFSKGEGSESKRSKGPASVITSSSHVQHLQSPTSFRSVDSSARIATLFRRCKSGIPHRRLWGVNRPSGLPQGIRFVLGAARQEQNVARGSSPPDLTRGEPVARGRVDASEPRAGLRHSRRADGGRDFRRLGGRQTTMR